MKWPVSSEYRDNAIGSAQRKAGENVQSGVVVFARKKARPPFRGDNSEEAASLGGWRGALAFLA